MKGSYLDSDIAEIADRLGEKADMLSGKTVLLTGARGFLGRSRRKGPRSQAYMVQKPRSQK